MDLDYTFAVADPGYQHPPWFGAIQAITIVFSMLVAVFFLLLGASCGSWLWFLLAIGLWESIVLLAGRDHRGWAPRRPWYDRFNRWMLRIEDDGDF